MERLTRSGYMRMPREKFILEMIFLTKINLIPELD